MIPSLCGQNNMFTLRQPSEEAIRPYLARQADEAFSYNDIGCTRAEPWERGGWNIDRHRVRLGTGRDAFEAAKDAIRRWRMFPQNMTRLCGSDRPPEVGRVVGVLYRVWLVPLWILFPACVVYCFDEAVESERGPIERFGFAYGTLADHPEQGEERFSVEWHAADDSVWYDLLSVSRPAHWLARLGYPYTRYEQARFRWLSGEAIKKATCRVGRASETSADPRGIDADVELRQS
jgi:uncharacterized protein (UPF0548 family)